MIKQVIVTRTDLNMRKGKLAAQAAHASLAVILQSKIGKTQNNFIVLKMNDYLKQWLEGSFTKIVLGIESEEALISLHEKIKQTEIPVALIVDNGTTEFHGVKTPTCIAIGPWIDEEIDVFTKELKLI